MPPCPADRTARVDFSCPAGSWIRRVYWTVRTTGGKLLHAMLDARKPAFNVSVAFGASGDRSDAARRAVLPASGSHSSRTAFQQTQ